MAMYLGFDADRLTVRNNDLSMDVQFDDRTGPWLRDMLESRWPSTTRNTMAEPTEPGLYVPANADMENEEYNFVLFRDSCGIWSYVGGANWSDGSSYATWREVIEDLDEKCFPLRRLKIVED